MKFGNGVYDLNSVFKVHIYSIIISYSEIKRKFSGFCGQKIGKKDVSDRPERLGISRLAVADRDLVSIDEKHLRLLTDGRRRRGQSGLIHGCTLLS